MSSGVQRVLLKLEASIANGNYYEAHQMYRTLYFRYIGQKKFWQVLELLFEGSLTFLNHEQYSSAADLALLIIDTLEKNPTDASNLWIHRLGIIISKLPADCVERETVIAKSIKWSTGISNNSLGHPFMHKTIAAALWAEGNIEQSRYHYLLSGNGIFCGKMLVQLSQRKGFASEIDLFIAQMILQQLSLKEKKTASETFETYIINHPNIANSEPPFMFPLLNFLFFLLKTIETGKLATFKTLCELYKPSLDRDPAYEKYLQKIGEIFFGAAQPQQSSFGGIFGNLFSQLIQGLDEDDEDGSESNDSRQQQQQSSSNGRPNTNVTEVD